MLRSRDICNLPIRPPFVFGHLVIRLSGFFPHEHVTIIREESVNLKLREVSHALLLKAGPIIRRCFLQSSPSPGEAVIGVFASH
jgi:hypothetical protein